MDIPDLLSSLTEEERAWVAKLQSPELGQEHLIKAAASADDIRNIVQQLKPFDASYPGGLLGYVQKARGLLREAKDNVNPLKGYKAEVPLRERLGTGTQRFLDFEKLGLSQLQYAAFVLVAGGLGERLEYYAQLIFACQTEVKRLAGKQLDLPLVIMTSDDTHNSTLALLDENRYFGLLESQVTVIKQEKVPAFFDNEARLAFKREKETFTIDAKPHGHGDIHILLNQRGLPRQWVDEGRRWVFFFQDTNVLVSHALPVLLGASAAHGLAMNTLTVPRNPGEAVGAVCRLIPVDPNDKHHFPMTINVEYNRLAAVLGDQDVPDPSTGKSPYPGNTNVLVFNLVRYRDAVEKTKGIVPEFVNPKYLDATKTIFKSSARLECLMQDFPRLLDPSDPVGVTELDRWACYSTVKNNSCEAAVKSKSNLSPECPFSAEADFYAANCQYLALAAKANGITTEIAEPEPTEFSGVQYKLGPKVVILPSFGFTLTQLRRRIRGPIKLHQNSSLVLEGNVELNGLDLDGALQLRNSKQDHSLYVNNLTVRNKGLTFVGVDPSDTSIPNCYRMRGYSTQQLDTANISI